MHALTFAENYVFIVGALILLAGCGWSVVATFQGRVRDVVLLAPLAGILVLTLATLGFYVIFQLPLWSAATAGLCTTLAATLGSLALHPPGGTVRSCLWPLGLTLAVSAVAVYLVTATSLRFGEPAFLYAEGTDHLGYAHVADWLTHHRASDSPINYPRGPYESWPALVFQSDPRFGSFAFLGLVSLATGESGMFAYDLAVALILVATVLAVAAVFARSRLTMFGLTAGLLTCHWFDYGQMGFFGKVLGYPSAFLVAGLFLVAATGPIRPGMMAGLAVLMAGTAVMHSGLATALFVGLIGGSFLAVRALLARREALRPAGRELMEGAAALALLVGIAVLSSGTLARPLVTTYPDWHVGWRYILPRLADLENQVIPVAGISPGALAAAAWVELGLWLGLGVMAVRQRAVAAIALLAGPLLLLVVLYLLDAKMVAFQLIGTFYPLSLCGMAVLFDGVRQPAPPGRSWTATMGRPALLTLGAAVITLGLHGPRLAGACSRFGGDSTPAEIRFSKSQMNQLAAVIGQATVDVDLGLRADNASQLALALLVEFGRRGLALQWQPDAWRLIVSYRGWPPPQYPRAGAFRLITVKESPKPSETIVFRTEQYLLLQPRP